MSPTEHEPECVIYYGGNNRAGCICAPLRSAYHRGAESVQEPERLAITERVNRLAAANLSGDLHVLLDEVLGAINDLPDVDYEVPASPSQQGAGGEGLLIYECPRCGHGSNDHGWDIDSPVMICGQCDGPCVAPPVHGPDAEAIAAKVTEILIREGADSEGGWHSWRCFDKGRYPDPCNCTTTVAEFIAAALVESVAATTTPEDE